MNQKLNRAQLGRIRDTKREVADMLRGARIFTRYNMPKGESKFVFADGIEFTFDQLVARRLARKAMG